VWPVVARAQKKDRVRRIGVLMPVDENDAEGKRRFTASMPVPICNTWEKSSGSADFHLSLNGRFYHSG
jgi:hypothetical protein